MKKLLTGIFILFSITAVFASAEQRQGDQKRRVDDPAGQTFTIISSGATDLTQSPQVNYMESFENPTFPPAGWVKFSPDGGTGWEQLQDGTTPIPGWQGGTATVPPGGGSYMAFCTWTTGGAASNDQWLVTPEITNVQPGDSLFFWIRYFANNFTDTRILNFPPPEMPTPVILPST